MSLIVYSMNLATSESSKTELQISPILILVKDFAFEIWKQITKIELYDYSGKKLKESASKEMNISSLQRVKITHKSYLIRMETLKLKILVKKE